MSETAQKRYRRVFNAWTGGEKGYALELCREVVRDFPDHNSAWLLEGTILTETARYAEAEQVLREGIQGLALEHLHYVLRAQERYAEALECFKKALEITPDYEEAIVGKSDMEKVIELLKPNDQHVKAT